jgi:Transposase, Mutator family
MAMLAGFGLELAGRAQARLAGLLGLAVHPSTVLRLVAACPSLRSPPPTCSGPAQIDQQQLAQELVDRARTEGVELIGPGGLLSGLTKTVLETALEAEMSEHLGYDKHDPMGRNRGYSRNGSRAKTVLTEIGPVEIEVPATGMPH